MKTEVKQERKPLEYYLNLNYPVTLYPEQDGGYTVLIKDLSGCMSQGETAEEAMSMIEDARRLWLEVAYEHGDPIPLPETEREYSGRFVVRLPKSLHRHLAETAKQEDTSLNQHIVFILSKKVGYKTAKDKFKKASSELDKSALSSSSGSQPHVDTESISTYQPRQSRKPRLKTRQPIPKK